MKNGGEAMNAPLEPFKMKQWYSDRAQASQFLERRFATPYGRVLHERQRRFVEEIIRRHAPASAVDIACGPGRMLPTLGTLPLCVALDFSEEMLTQVRNRLGEAGLAGRVGVARGDVFSLPLRSESFDLAVSLRFVRHFKHAERKKIYEAVKRVLKPGGIFVFDAVNFDVSYPVRKIDNMLECEIYDRLYRRRDLEEELEENGLKPVRIQGVYHQYLKARFVERVFMKLKLSCAGYAALLWNEMREKGEPLEWMVACRK